MIGKNFILYETVPEIWEAARKTYSNTEDTTAAFEIKGKIYAKVICLSPNILVF